MVPRDEAVIAQSKHPLSQLSSPLALRVEVPSEPSVVAAITAASRQCSYVLWRIRGSIGVIRPRARLSSMAFAPASARPSARGAASICNPTGRPLVVNPHGIEMAGQLTRVNA